MKPLSLSWLPFGHGRHQNPRYVAALAQAVWENRDHPGYAWRVLKHGVCDGCSLGPYGLKDNVVEGIHLCATRLKLLRVHTMGPLDERLLKDISTLREMDDEQLQRLGRLPFPMVYREGDEGFTRVSWEKAVGLLAEKLLLTPPDRVGFLASACGLTNETCYVLQKLARFAGTNNVALCSRSGDRAGAQGLEQALGIPAATCSLEDFIGTDLLVLFGADVAARQPVMMRYLREAKRRGTKLFVVNPVRERGLQRYRIPGIGSSAPFGIRMVDHHFAVDAGGDIAFVNGVLKWLLEKNATDQAFIEAHTSNFAALAGSLRRQTWESLETASGLKRADMERCADACARARTAAFVYSTGLTRHEFGAENVRAICNLALARGMIGREQCGVMPIRDHASAQGAAECGVDADRLPGGFEVNAANAERLGALWGFAVPAAKGLKLGAMLEAACRSRMDVLYAIGGNLLETMPDPDRVCAAVRKLKLRVHQDLALNRSTVAEGPLVLVLPAQTLYEQKSGGTITSTERRVRFTPEIAGHQVGESKPAWQIPCLVARRMHPETTAFDFRDTTSIRDEMVRVIPFYQGVEALTKEGQWVQWGGRQLHAGGRFGAMPDGRAEFCPLTPPRPGIPPDRFCCWSRRGAPFDSVRPDGKDSSNATGRRAVVMSKDDMKRLGYVEGDAVVVRSESGELRGRVRAGPIKPRHIITGWPEGHILFPPARDPLGATAACHAFVTVERDTSGASFAGEP